MEFKKYNFGFHGKGTDFFVIQIVNLFLTVITLGFYYPWAKARTLQFIYSNTELEASRFEFHGTGKEMFKGYIKALLIVFLIYGFFLLLTFLEMAEIGILFLYVSILAILPLIIHGSYRYRMSRSSWRGIRFGYRGSKKELVLNFYRDLFLTVITLGIYGSWLSMNLRRYVIGHIRLGSAQFEYKGNGGDYLFMNIFGYFGTIFTLGIYFFWWQKDLFHYYVNNLSLKKDEHEIKFYTDVQGMKFLALTLTNLLIIIFTLGIGFPFAAIRTINFVLENIELYGEVDLEQVLQTEDTFVDATAEDLADFFDMDFIL